MLLECMEQGRFIELTIGYTKGGLNWFTGKQEDRCFYLSITPIKIETHNYNGREWQSKSSMLGHGYKVCTMPIMKKSEKAFREAIEDLKSRALLVKSAIFKVLEEEDLLLKDSNAYDIDWTQFSYKEI